MQQQVKISYALLHKFSMYVILPPPHGSGELIAWRPDQAVFVPSWDGEEGTERAPTIGRPLGRPEWIAILERRLGRPLVPRKPGQSREWSGTPRGKRSCCET